MVDENKNTVLGVTENLEGLFCYVLGWVTGLIFLLLEQKNAFVRFHALQSLVTFLALFILSAVIGFIPVLGILVGLILWPCAIVLFVNLLRQKRWTGLIQSVALIVLCSWQAWVSTRGVIWTWTHLFRWLTHFYNG